jgi:hypothetical protein
MKGLGKKGEGKEEKGPHQIIIGGKKLNEKAKEEIWRIRGLDVIQHAIIKKVIEGQKCHQLNFLVTILHRWKDKLVHNQ